MISFDEGEDIIANGEKAGKAKSSELEQLKRIQNEEPNRPLLQPLDSLNIKSVLLQETKNTHGLIYQVN